ncbi:class I SAM-dependent methyltransferase [Paenibacillus urinalis]|uniref:Methyltransferase domain-containing protein n=1 Tax=Paenibacillus urinalis TaxID=521520 RepID=A0AAX3N2J7_9BACL|nr:class I SAM-dependent methyltransferase [Paenibacillus urinalis]WDH83334.1 methyltransferase domain-containing protein [Paenibacillus urinalis]
MASDIYEEILQSHCSLFDANAREYEQRTQAAYSKYLQSFADSFLDQLKGRRIADLGCGPGRDLGYFISHGYDAVGIDGSQGMIELCRSKGLPVLHHDFLSVDFEPASLDGVWAYTSFTLVPKSVFREMLSRLSRMLKSPDGIAAFGMIAGNGEGWKQDHKYGGVRRYVARYSRAELESILLDYFGSVWIEEVADPEKPERVYLHALCRNTAVSAPSAAGQAAKRLFNSFASVYEQRTQTGIALLEDDRRVFAERVGSGGRILDVGAGPGRDAKLFMDCGLRPVCVDISEANVELCASKGLEAVVGDIAELDRLFEPQSFDGIWANCSVTNWIPKKALKDVLRQLKSLAKPGAPIFIGSVLGGFQGWEADNKYDGLPRYNTHWKREELKDVLQELGEPFYSRHIPAEQSLRKAYLNTIHLVSNRSLNLEKSFE